MSRAIGVWTAAGAAYALSTAANVAWAAPRGYVELAAGATAPALLLLAVHICYVTPRPAALGWLRRAAMVAVTGTVATWSAVHIIRLLLEARVEAPLAWVAPLGLDGLAVLATLALWDTRRAETVPVAVQTDIPAPPVTEPVAPGPPAVEPQERALHAVGDELDGMNRAALRRLAQQLGVRQNVNTLAELRGLIRAARARNEVAS